MARTLHDSSSCTKNITAKQPFETDESQEIDVNEVDKRKDLIAASINRGNETEDEGQELKIDGEGATRRRAGRGQGQGQRQDEEAPEEVPLRNEARGQRKCTSVLVVLVVLALPIILAILGQRFYSKEDLETPPERIRVFNKSFDQLKASFPRQTPRFWRILRNRAFAHLKNPNPKKALVFMFTAAPSAHTVLECIARKFAQSLEQEDNGGGYINSKDYHKYSSLDDAKKILDETLKGHLQKRRTVLIFDVDKLPEQCPLLFYEYCDNENAPYKKGAIIFTVRLPLEPNSSLEPAKAEGLVVKYLKKTWGEQDYRPDDIPPLVNRITDTVVMVNKGSDQTLKRICGI